MNRPVGLVKKFLRDDLKIQNAQMMIAGIGDNGEDVFVRHNLKRPQHEVAFPLVRDEGSLYGQFAVVYEKDNPLWIVSAKGRHNLESCSGYIDMWSAEKKIPKYKKVGKTEEPVKTRIVIPLKTKSKPRVFGTLVLESSDYLEITEAAKNELQKIADSLYVDSRKGSEFAQTAI